MEDLPRDLEKAVGATPLSRPRKRRNHWTLLFVGDQGRIIRIKRFKGLLALSAVLFTFFTAAAVVLYFLHQNQSKDYLKLQESLELAKVQAKSLRNEKDILMARIVVAESKLAKGKKAAAKKPKKETPKKKAAAPPPPPPMPVKKEPIQPEPEMVAVVSPPPPIVPAEPKPESKPEPAPMAAPVQPPVKEELPEVVAVDDFFALVEEGSNTLRIKYKIRNIAQRSSPVAGRTFVVLKPKQEKLDDWLILPSVPMNSGKPLRIKGGRSFSITRFKTIRFKAPYRKGPQPFTKATILIYATSGDLLLEKSFPIAGSGRKGQATG